MASRKEVWLAAGVSIGAAAEGGTVFLRGQLESEQLIQRIAESVRDIPDVQDLVNLPHSPGTEAPHAQPRRRSAGAHS